MLNRPEVKVLKAEYNMMICEPFLRNIQFM